MEGKVSGYKLIKEIYKGSLANIYLATRIKDGKNFAIKRMFKSLINDKTYRDCMECHLKPDWLLIYKYINDNLVLLLVATGSHSEILDK